MFDLVGDIHGHADLLARLLARLGYRRRGESFAHPARQMVFVGDFIDRGPQIRQVLDIVRPMVESGHALAVMGNHELNALAFHTVDPCDSSRYLRPHSPKNVAQHQSTLDQLSPAALRDALDWFRTLPLWLELKGLRVVHACWDPASIALVQRWYDPARGLTADFLERASRPGEPLFEAVEVLLKGKEARLPDGQTMVDKDGHKRQEIRTRWYLPADGHTYTSYAFSADPVACDVPLDSRALADCHPYPADAKPVFFGHYWLRDSEPGLLAPNVACLDYSVARGGFLCAYRFSGERPLDASHFVAQHRG